MIIDVIWGILSATVDMFLEMAPYLLLGLFFVGILHLFFTKDLIVRHVGANNFSSVLKAALLGVPLPLCSCGVIPSAVFMAKNGASRGAVISFLISTPQTGIDSMIATYGMLGWVFAIFRPIAAFIMGIIGGISALIFIKDEKVSMPAQKLAIERINPADVIDDDGCGLPEQDHKQLTIKQKAQTMFRYSFVEFLDDISAQFFVGLIISGLIAYFIPAEFFANTSISNGLPGMLLMILIGIPMYVCATASIPIAVTLMMKGFSPGVAFAFLAAGPATNAASLSILIKALGKKTTILFVAVIAILSLIMGLLLDEIFKLLGINEHMLMSHMHHTHNIGDEKFQLILGIIFFILLMMSFYRKYLSNKFKRKVDAMPHTFMQKFSIEGMTCNHCVMNVKKAIENVKGVDKVEVKLSDNMAYVEGEYNPEDIKKSVEAVGYRVAN